MLLTRAPVAGRNKQAYSPAAPRLACVKPVASVHPEPGSNSSLLFILSFFFLLQKSKKPRRLSLLFAFTARLVGGARPILTMTANESAVTGLTQVSRADALPFPATLAGRRGGLRLVNLLRIEQRLACFSADLLLYYSLSLL